MQALVAFKNVKPSDDLKNYLNGKLERFEKMFHHPGSVHAVLRLEKSRCIVEISIVAKDFNVHAVDEGNNFNQAIDLVVEKVKKQLVRTKEKFAQRR